MQIFRRDTEDRLRGAGVDLRWKVVDLPPLPSLTPESVLAILRICQEAFANALKHSGATAIEVSTGIEVRADDVERAFVSIADNGRGIGARRSGGRGLDNMRRRAEALDGELIIESALGQTKVMLIFPTARDSAATVLQAAS